MKKIIVFIALICLLAVPVYAQDSYATQYENVVADTLDDGLDEQTRELF